MKTKLLGLIVAAALLGAGVWLAFRQSKAPAGPSGGESAGAQDRKSAAPAFVPRALDETLAQAASPPIRQLVGLEGDCGSRLALVAGIRTNRLPADQEALRGFLLRRCPSDDEPLGHFLKNRILDELCQAQPPAAWLAETLVQMYRDPNQHEVIRDYAVQHLVAFYDQVHLVYGDQAQTRGGELSLAGQVLYEALDETGNSIAGTALLGLERLSEKYSEFDRAGIAEAALRLAGPDGGGELTRMTGMQVGARLGVEELLPVLLEVAERGETLPLRIAAVGALGVLGRPEARPLLTSISNEAEPRLKLPAEQALARIAKREQDGNGAPGEL